jgi:hypothetical protein
MKGTLLIIILFLIVSCEPNKDEIGAGIIDKNVVYNGLSPAMQITNPGKDSIDFNNDSQYDIVFYKSAVPLLTGFGIITEFLKKVNLQIAIDNNGYPACLDYKDVINHSTKWSESNQALLVLQSYKCNSYDCPSIGNFTNVTDKYLAFKMGDYLGWIQLDNSAGGELKIKGYAISK